PVSRVCPVRVLVRVVCRVEADDPRVRTVRSEDLPADFVHGLGELPAADQTDPVVREWIFDRTNLSRSRCRVSGPTCEGRYCSRAAGEPVFPAYSTRLPSGSRPPSSGGLVTGSGRTGHQTGEVGEARSKRS